MKPVILLDIDGVCADFITPVLEAVYEITGINYAVSAVTEWDLAKSLSLDVQDQDFLDDRISERYFCRDLLPYNGALEGVNELRKFADVYAVTSPFNSDYWMRERELWLCKHMRFRREDIIFTSAKHRIRGDVLVDDKTSTVVKWCDENPGKTGVVFTRSWNVNDVAPDMRVNGWLQLVSALKMRLT